MTQNELEYLKYSIELQKHIAQIAKIHNNKNSQQQKFETILKITTLNLPIFRWMVFDNN